jgi:hypothetical protein
LPRFSHCPVSSGRSASALADFNATNKTLVLPDLRGRALIGRDQMEAPSAAGRLTAANFISAGDGIA